MIDITSKDSNISGINEDGWFCLRHSNEMNICDLKTACNFSMESMGDGYLDMIDTVPMGLHGPVMKQFWNDKTFINKRNKRMKNTFIAFANTTSGFS